MHANHDSHNLLAWVLVAGEIDLDEGITAAEKALEIPPEYGDLSWITPFVPCPEHTLGLAQWKKGETQQAIEWLEKAAEVRPNRTLIQDHLAQVRASR
jgi:hypothetical protein